MGGRAGAFRAVLGLSTALMLGLSWPLWVEPGAIPRVPLVPLLDPLDPLASWALFLGLEAALLLAAVGIRPRPTLALAAAGFGVFVLLDQHRLQPWAYQAGLLSLALASLPTARALRLCRLFVVALYLHSGLSKLDASFATGLGPLFLRALTAPLGLRPTDWPAPWRGAAILAMPLVEIAVALALAAPRTRRYGAWGAVGLHAALLAALGPWALDHSTIVLAWNLALATEVLILFGSGSAEPVPPAASQGRVVAVAEGLFVALVLIAPFGERWGLLDSWPAFALYSSHAERAEILIHRDELDTLDAEERASCRETAEPGWHRLDLTAWSRHVRGVPVYPQNRAGLGLARGLLDRHPRLHLVRVVLHGRADAVTGRRGRKDLVGRAAIEGEAGSSWWNSRPSIPGL